MTAEAVLATLLAQAEVRGVDLVTLRALVEESSQAGARRALASLGLDDGGGLLLSWTRRSRQGFAWGDEIDAPLGESREQYGITLTGMATQIDATSDQPSSIVSADAVAGLGVGPVNIEVRQIGDFATSHPAQTTITLS